MSPPSPSLSDQSDPPSPCPSSTDSEDMQEHIHFLPRPAQNLDGPFFLPATPDDEPPIPDVTFHMVGATLAIHASVYVARSLVTKAWGTRAIEYAMGTTCVVTIAYLLLAKRRRLTADTYPGWARARGRGRLGNRSHCAAEEGRRFVALVCALSSSIAGIGYHVRSLVMDGAAENPAYLMLVSWSIVPVLLAVVIVLL